MRRLFDSLLLRWLRSCVLFSCVFLSVSTARADKIQNPPGNSELPRDYSYYCSDIKSQGYQPPQYISQMCIWNGNKYFGYDIDYTAKRIVNPDNGKPEYFVTCEIRSSCTGGMTMHEIGICPYKTALDSEKAITGPEEKCKEALTFFKKATVYMNATVGDLEDAEAACRPNTKEFQNWFSDYIAALKSWCSLFTTPPNAQTSFKIECCAPPNIGKPADSN